MKIAVVSDDGINVSQHYGRAPYYAVFTVEDGKIGAREVRSKVYHGQTEHHSHDDGNIHTQMASPLADCTVVLAGGMGAGAYQSLRAHGVQPAFVSSTTAEDAVADFLAGRIVEHRLCQH
jgi:predicted Fe-Mo cluster-binding NifX family protein